jgi:hypothetical protein
MSPYANRVTALVEKDATGGPGCSRYLLLCALGCMSMGDTEDPGFQIPTCPALSEEVFVRTTLIALLRSQERANLLNERRSEGFSLLHGLCQRGRWRPCLDNSDDAHRFAELLLLFHYQFDYAPFELTDAMQEIVASVQAQWLGDLYMPYDRDISTFYDVIKALFGAPWCALALEGENLNFREIMQTFINDKPPFLPGLLKEVAPAAAVLPTLGTEP